MNERITERIVRENLNASISALPPTTGDIRYWEQVPEDNRIKKLLKKASKQGGGAGRPEFIVLFDEYPNFLIVIECKSSPTRHQSKKSTGLLIMRWTGRCIMLRI